MGDESDQLTPLKRAFLAIEDLQARLAASERALSEPIALVGIGCRLPGGADGPDALWQVLHDGVDAIGDVPPDRWDIEAYYDADHSAPGKMSTRHGGFLRDVDRFEPQLFGIAPREAAAMDPQQRLLLEVAWEALEHAGQAPAKLAGSRTGVFVGITTGDYAQLTLNTQGIEGLGAYYASGIAHSIASGRLSYVLGLEGPSISLDTACSSSLVAIHLAVQSLRLGESDLALAGGVNLILGPEMSITLSKYQMMAPDGRCKFADASADGFVRAEGCALVVLKRLSDALADGDRVLAVIRGSAVSQDGASSGLTAPNGPAQEAVIRAALSNGGVHPGEVSYVEAHGTGTALGDPIEVQALGAVFGPGRPAGQPLLVGSVKTNLGHLEAAAGVTGLIKLALMLQHCAIPASLHLATPSPHIPWEELPVTVPVALQPWPATGGRRLAGLSSFGFSGTNVHLVLEEPPPAEPVPTTDERPLHLLALSARTEPALRELAGRYAGRLAGPPAPNLADVAYTAGSGRSHLAHRLAAVAADTAGAARQLAAFAAGESAPGLVHHGGPRTDPPKVAFLFTGQGAQHAGMGRGLYATQPVFRDALDRCAAILAGHLDVALVDLLFAEPGSASAGLLDQTAYTQPALVALEHALAELWRSWGITPSVVMGHSVGEYTAAILAGVMTLEDGLALVAARGRMMQRLPAGGAMAAIFAGPAEVEAAVGAHAGTVSVAAYNGPAHTVVAGPAAPIQALADRFTAAGVRVQTLNVSHAFHSPLLEPMLDELEAAAGSITLRPPRLRMISNLTGAPAGAEITEPSYWRRHAREAVRFGQGVEHLDRLGCEVFIEIGPHPTLIGMARAVLAPERGLWLPSLRKGQDDWQQLLQSVASLYVHGSAIDWQGFDGPYPRRKLALPTYPFQRERYWITTEPGRPRRAAGEHPLLGRRLRSALTQVQFEQELSARSVDYLDDHRVFGAAILPATGFVELALAAGTAAGPATGLEAVELLSALVVDEGETRALQTILAPGGDGTGFEILSQGEDEPGWQLHARGRVSTAAALSPEPADLDAILSRCSETISAPEHYTRLRERGLEFGPSLRGVEQVWRGDGEVLGEIVLPAERAAYRMHPALLDACLQTVAWLAKDSEATYLPIAIGRVDLHGTPGARVWAHATVPSGEETSHETLLADVWVYDEAGEPVAAVRGLCFKRAGRDALLGLGRTKMADWLYELAWRPQPSRSLVASLDAIELPAPTELAAAADDHSAGLQVEHDLGRHQGLLDALEVLSGDYVVLALEQLGVTLTPGRRFTTAELGVVAQHQRLVDRLLAGLADEGLLRKEDGGWMVLRAPAAVDTAARWAQLAEQYPQGRGELTIARRCGESLAAALRGEVDPLQLLFPGGSTEAAEQMYQGSPFAHFYNSLVGEAVAAAVDRLPRRRRLRVLEIGAGTGGTTAYVLPRLPADRAEYTFTDISPLFVARAREKFSTHPFVSYRSLDIEADPEAQGFAPHQYDLVVAANVLHATADLRRTFDHVARLLAPGGILVLLEMTKPQRFIDISFGLTPGWWKLTDEDVRPDYLLLDRAGWLRFLADAGYAEPAAAPALQPAAADLSLQTLLIAGGPTVASEPSRLPAGRQSWLILADAGGTGATVADLITAGGTTTLVTAGTEFRRTGADRYEIDPTSPEQMTRLVREAPDGAWDGVVHLWSLDPPAATMPAATMPATQARRTGSALSLAQALLDRGAPPRLWLVTRGAQALLGEAPDPTQAPLWGLGRVVALEHPELLCTRVDLDPAATADPAEALLDELLAADGEDQVAHRTDVRYVARLVRCPEAARPPGAEPAVRLDLPRRGVLDDLALRPVARRAPGPGEIEIRVHAAGLNFRDVMNALAMRDDQEPAGSECAGVVVTVGPGVSEFTVGDAVVAVAQGCFGSFVTTPTDLAAPKPARLTFAQAATIPLAFLTAHYALHGQAHVARGETVLIHAAAGGVGLAAVQLARRAGAVPLGTAGHPRKRAYLASQGLGPVMDSRTLAFADEVKTLTDGRGVDVVLNSLTGDSIARSLDVLAAGGRFVELGKREVLTEEQVAADWPGVTYHTVPLAEDLVERPARVRPLLRELVAAVDAGELEPLPTQCFALAEAADAFRTMAQARHIGKIVLVRPEAAAAPPAGPALVREDATYLVTGGLGGLGLLVAEWLAEQGARHLALLGRSGPGDVADAAIARMQAHGARVLVLRADVSVWDEVAGALAAVAAQLPPVRGVIHSAGVLDDGALLRQDWTRFATVMAPKVEGAWNLHELTMGLPLDHFVLFSSAASLFGSPGQANHAAANSFLDALAADRRAHGRCGLSINWGGWSEVGSVVTHAVGERITTRGTAVMTPRQGLDALAALMSQGRPQLGVVPMDWPVFLRQFAPGAEPGWLSEVAHQPTRGAAVSTPSAPEAFAIRQRLAAAQPAQQEEILLDFVSAQVARVLGAGERQSIDERQPLHELGLDSLMAVELRNLLGAGLALEPGLPATLVFDYPTVEALAGYLATTALSPELSADHEPDDEPDDQDLLAAIELMSDEDVARLMAD